MWKHKRLFFIVGGILGLIIIVQLAYPREIALPLATVGERSVRFQQRNDLAAQFQQSFERTVLTVSNGDRVATRKLAVVGAALNADRMAQTLTEYPLWRRFIPFTLFLTAPKVTTLDIDFSGTRVEVAAADIARELSYAPTDASLAITEGELSVVGAENGKAVAAKDVRAALIAGGYVFDSPRLTVRATTTSPGRANADVAAAKAQAEGALTRPITLRVEGKGEFTPDKATRASWLAVKLDTSPATLSVNRELAMRYVTDINSKVAVAPKNTLVSIVDGQEVARTEGESGSSLDVATVTSQLIDSLLDATKPALVDAVMQPVVPQVTTNRTYTHSEQGLRAYVAYATSTQNVRIVVKQLDGERWSASGRANESIPSASTFKLYVAKMLFKKMEEGTIRWEDPMLDTTVSGCFDRMTIASTNPCAIEWLNQFERGALNEYLYSLGFSRGTTFTARDAVHTTAADLAQFMVGLEDGSLVGGEYRDRLYRSLSSHPFRTGIPAGAKGAVYDKVGFLWDYIHDSAIVYGPKGKYVLVVMTKGYSYGYIANVARQIETIMYE